VIPKRVAREHLAKAREFLEAAEIALEAGLPNPAVSAAVISGINSKDAICLKRIGSTSKTENHATALRGLRAAGPDAAPLATVLQRLLSAKSKAQYRAASIGAPDAHRAVAQARKLFEAAQLIVSS